MFVKMDEGLQSGERPVVISIEGNIGSGKTTVINYLKQFDNVQAHAEPVEKWQVLKLKVLKFVHSTIRSHHINYGNKCLAKF